MPRLLVTLLLCAVTYRGTWRDGVRARRGPVAVGPPVHVRVVDRPFDWERD